MVSCMVETKVTARLFKIVDKWKFPLRSCQAFFRNGRYLTLA